MFAASIDFRVPASFFFIGAEVERYPKKQELAELLVLGGHTVGNHSYSHPNFLKLKKEQLAQELERTEQLLKHHFPNNHRSLFRPPFGYRNRLTLEEAKKRELRVIGWNLNSLDFLGRGADFIIRRVEEKAFAGSLLLFHDGPKDRGDTLEALPRILEVLQNRGYDFHKPS